jgi:hypothetical protein
MQGYFSTPVGAFLPPQVLRCEWRGAGWPPVAPHTTTAEVLPHADHMCRRWAAVVMGRKKHSAKIGVRVRKSDVEPPNAIRREEIVEEIVDHLRPWKNRKSNAAITAEVNQELDVLLKLAPLETKLYDRTRNRNSNCAMPAIYFFQFSGALISYGTNLRGEFFAV